MGTESMKCPIEKDETPNPSNRQKRRKAADEMPNRHGKYEMLKLNGRNAQSTKSERIENGRIGQNAQMKWTKRPKALLTGMCVWKQIKENWL